MTNYPHLEPHARRYALQAEKFAAERNLGPLFMEPALELAEATRPDGSVDTSKLSPETRERFLAAVNRNSSHPMVRKGQEVLDRRRRERLTAADGSEEKPLPNEPPED
ncbi:hypothetical protein [Zhihengliuella halotolerans]|uniref:hypothetical protein n=1 Tax=Zhihengliuella halotolerans TaxID=370736 RepID=UPI0011AF3FB8|nr:hypothetical protein [Zhihengliuella halotolerans]